MGIDNQVHGSNHPLTPAWPHTQRIGNTNRSEDVDRPSGGIYEEVLQLYDHLCDGSREAVPASELLFGVVRLVSPAGSADYLQAGRTRGLALKLS